MVIRSKENTLGAWAFLIGVILAVIIGLSTTLLSIPYTTKFSGQIYTILVLLGVGIGFINVNEKDNQIFLIAGSVLVVVSKFGMDGVRNSLIGIEVVNIVVSIFGALLALFVPATIIVALKTVFSISKV